MDAVIEIFGGGSHLATLKKHDGVPNSDLLSILGIKHFIQQTRA